MKRTFATLVILLLATALNAQQILRTGAIADRGLKLSDFPQTKKLAENVYIFSDVHSLGYMTNNLVVITSDGVLVADGQSSPQVTQKLVDQIRQWTSQPIKYVVVCSEHGDHTGGHSSFPSTATFISSPFSRSNLQAQAANDRPNGNKTIVPAETVADKRVLKLGNTEIQILYNGRAHTGGDLEVYLPKEKILFLSEVFSNHIFPSMRTAAPTEWISTLKAVAKIDADVWIPGHGFVDEPSILKEEFAEFAKAVEYVVAESKRVLAAVRNQNAASPVEEALKLADWGPYEKWTSKERNAAIAMQRVFDEISGKLK